MQMALAYEANAARPRQVNLSMIGDAEDSQRLQPVCFGLHLPAQTADFYAAFNIKLHKTRFTQSDVA